MTERIKKVNRLIQRELFQIIKKEVDFPSEIYLTLTKAEASADLKHVRVYISVMPEQEALKALKILEREVYHLQKKMNKRLNMKFVPKIYFVLEKETAKAGRIEEILEKLKK